MKRSLLALSLCCALAAPFPAQAYLTELKDGERISVASMVSAPVSAAQVRDALVNGAAAHGWMLVSETPGRVVLSLMHRGGKHKLEVAAIYSESEYRFEYLSSDNLKYAQSADGSRMIDNAYYRWTASITRAAGQILRGER
ncbi:hypothetical protein OPU71_16085 [Niveibacterium sp. 24ML]|uniref:hypothetical protein n=1 Tax=Niveibacterium sp. 24ML TaxID=2985512 RepID=UPI00226F8294|nr:hypothetical protein [Niveibacterium sp. 24ML]MCX9157647.1 hypothetical protein [Niveibacterium sp. 24ML]